VIMLARRSFLFVHAARRLSSKAGEGMTPTRPEMCEAKRVVVKVGTAVVANSDGTLALSRLGALVEQLSRLKEEGRQVLLVSSGAMGLGRQSLGLSKELVGDPNNIIDRQACAAAGQKILMSMYNMMFQALNIQCSQVLITQGDFLSRTRYVYLTETLDRLTSMGVIPIINENDVVTGGISGPQVFSDNDKLSAILAAGADADALALLTDVDAVYDKPPDEAGAQRIKVYTPDLAVQIGEKSTMGRGGMAAKISAARVAASGGVHTVVASGFDLSNIDRVFKGADVGTLFPASERKSKRQRWLNLATESEGRLMVKAAARDSILCGQEHPLLVAQLDAVEGDFGKGAVVSLVDPEGTEFARGICTKPSAEIREGITTCDLISFNSAHPLVANNDFVLID